MSSGVGADERRGRLRELAAVFATLGLIGFGGPAAHIGLIRREAVERRRWLDDARLVDLVGLTSIIPGPNSTELAMLVGRERAGGWGLVVAGLAFIIPAAAIVLVVAWAYVAFGATPAADGLLYGIKPVVLAIVGAAIVAFARIALAGALRLAIGVAVAALWFAGIHELALLAGGALVMPVARGLGSGRGLARAVIGLPPATAVAGGAAQSVDLALLAGVFLKAGALLFGSGYVLLAFLRGDLVERLGWLTDAQLLDAIAIGQVTPGPLLTTATFVGYLLAGVPGAVVATVAIFAPAFAFTALVARVADRVRGRPLTAALLDGLNAAAVGLMAAVSIQLAATAIVDPLTLAFGNATVQDPRRSRRPDRGGAGRRDPHLVGPGGAAGHHNERARGRRRHQRRVRRDLPRHAGRRAGRRPCGPGSGGAGGGQRGHRRGGGGG